MNTRTEERDRIEDESLGAVCVSCGLVVADVPLIWTRQVGRHGPEWLCDNCTRENLSAIEGKLDEIWW